MMTASLLVWLASLWLYASPAVAVLFLVAAPAATRQDFWLRFPTPPVCVSLHYLFSPIDAALVGHIALGALQSQKNLNFAIVTAVSVATVCCLHAVAALSDRSKDRLTNDAGGWHDVARVDAFEEGLRALHICRLASELRCS